MDATTWDTRYREQDLVWSAEPNVFVARELADVPPGRALDLGAGEGRNAVWLAERGWDVEVVDFSVTALEKAVAVADRRGVRLTLTLADLTASPTLAAADLVLLAYVHLPRPQMQRVLRHVTALVRPGGTLLVVAHARSNLERGYGGPQDPAVLPTVDEVLDDLVETGLAIEKGGEVRRTVDTDDGPRVAIDLLVRARRPRV